MKGSQEKYICFIDFETTGSNPYIHFPIEIGAVLVRNNLSIINKFSSYIRPPYEARNTNVAFNIHQIRLDNLKNAPVAKDVVEEFFDKFGTNYNFASWNISFDVSFFRKLCNDTDKIESFNKIGYRHIDIQTVCSLARELRLIDSKVKSLDDCVRIFNLNRSKAHDALEDSMICIEVYRNLLTIFKS